MTKFHNNLKDLEYIFVDGRENLPIANASKFLETIPGIEPIRHKVIHTMKKYIRTFC